MRNDRDRLLDMLEAISKIEERLASLFRDFEADETLLVWTVYHLQVLGEAAARVSTSLRNEWPEIPWPEVTAMRNVLVHHYFGIDAREVWNTARNDLPGLKAQVRQILEKEFSVRDQD